MKVSCRILIKWWHRIHKFFDVTPKSFFGCKQCHPNSQEKSVFGVTAKAEMFDLCDIFNVFHVHKTKNTISIGFL